jgi:hypothetical protein
MKVEYGRPVSLIKTLFLPAEKIRRGTKSNERASAISYKFVRLLCMSLFQKDNVIVKRC